MLKLKERVYLILFLLLTFPSIVLALESPLKQAIYNLQVAAGIRIQTELSGEIAWIICPTEGARGEVTITNFLPPPEGKAIVIYKIDGLPRTDGRSYFISFYCPEQGRGENLYFTPENGYVWTGTIILHPGQKFMAKGIPVVPGPGQEFTLPNPMPFGFFATLLPD